MLLPGLCQKISAIPVYESYSVAGAAESLSKNDSDSFTTVTTLTRSLLEDTAAAADNSNPVTITVAAASAADSLSKDYSNSAFTTFVSTESLLEADSQSDSKH